MAEMGKYCKAYLLKKLRQFKGWAENEGYLRKDKKVVDGEEVEVARALRDDDVLYLQENYVVTDGIFKDENIVFDNITPGWKEYCQGVLEFEVPVYEALEAGEQET